MIPEAAAEVTIMLDLLSSRLGTVLLVGMSAFTMSYPFVLSFAELPVGKREAALQSWSASRFELLRKV